MFPHLPRKTARELCVFLIFVALTVVMTWPLAAHLRDAVSDPGDPYYFSWVLWWDYHQTFHDPLNLFHANILFPYRYTLAFAENLYGIALLCFPLFALGLRPLTVHAIAILLGFAFSGYGAFRLARTLAGSRGVAWVTGIAFAFIPYRFHQLPHVGYLFCGWIPLLLEALVLFLRQPTRRRAGWLGVAFFMNGLSSIHWLLLTIIPLILSSVVLLLRHGAWRNASLWRRGLAALAAASIGLLPFLLPYARASKLNGFVRPADETRLYSARLIDWFVGDFHNKMWHGLNAQVRFDQKMLFPGLLLPLLALAAIFLVKPETSGGRPAAHLRKLLVCLDALAIISGILIVTISGYGFFKLRVFGIYLFEIDSPAPAIVTLALALVVRVSIAWPEILKRDRERNIFGSVSSNRRSEAFWLGVVWTVTGFLTSLGMNFIFYRALYEFVPLFRSLRVPARAAMICFLGLALLAGLGARQLIELLSRHGFKVRPVVCYGAMLLAILVEQRAAPLHLVHGAVDPDALTLRLKDTPMAGGIVELPYGDSDELVWDGYAYVLRAADHARPLVTATSGFVPLIQTELKSLVNSDPIPDRFLDLLESIPCSYLVIHNRLLEPANRPGVQAMLEKGTSAGRLRFVRGYDDADLYAVTKTEPK